MLSSMHAGLGQGGDRGFHGDLRLDGRDGAVVKRMRIVLREVPSILCQRADAPNTSIPGASRHERGIPLAGYATWQMSYRQCVPGRPASHTGL